MSKKPTRSAKGDNSITKNDHLAALMKDQSALMKQLEEINERIKGIVMEESTSPLISVKIEEEEVIDLTSPNVKVENIVATSDDTTIKLEDVKIENVSTQASNIATASTVTRTNTTTPICVTKGKRNKKSLKNSPIQSMRQALKTIPGNRLLSPLRRGTDSRHTPPKANTLRDLDPIWLAAENNTIGELMHPVVPAKLSSIPLDGQPSESNNCIYHLKLYRRYDNGRTQLVMYAPTSGILKLNLMITSMNDLQYAIVRRKTIEVGVISFISMVRSGVPGQFKLRVNQDAVSDLYLKLVRLGASEKNTA